MKCPKCNGNLGFVMYPRPSKSGEGTLSGTTGGDLTGTVRICVACNIMYRVKLEEVARA